jgi:hypothetical protein
LQELLHLLKMLAAVQRGGKLLDKHTFEEKH